MEVKTKIQEKHKAWNKYKKNKTEDSWNKYTKSRNLASKVIHKSQIIFEEQIASEIQTNPKSFWRYVRGNRTRNIIELEDENKQSITTDEAVRATE